jgi:autotransporter-associated beta strand protein
MQKPFKKKWAVTALVSATTGTILLPIQRLIASSPTAVFTTVFNANSAIGFDGTNFTSLTVGVNFPATTTSTSIIPSNSLVNLDPSLLVGSVTNTNSASGITYSEIYAVNLANLSVSVVALNDSNHAIVDTNAGYVFSPGLAIVSSGGTIVGTQGTNATDNYGNVDPTGNDVFTSSNGAAPVVIPLPGTVLGGGAAYSYTNSQTGTPDHSLNASAASSFYSLLYSSAASSTGAVGGTIYRYGGDGSTAPNQVLGTDAFYFNPATGTTTAVGLTGGEYDTNISTTSQPLIIHGDNFVGFAGKAAVGYSELFGTYGVNGTTQDGNDGWMYTPALGTVQIGLVGGSYTYNNSGTIYESTQIFRTNTLGQIAGISTYANGASYPSGPSNPVDAWIYTPSATPGTASNFGNSSVGTYARLGLVGYASGTTLGYTSPVAGPTFSANFRYSQINFLANNGNAAGVSNRFDSSGNYQGQAAWYFNGSANIDISPNAINPSDTIHTAAAGGAVASNNTITAINNTGMVAAYATRIAGTASGSASLGQDAYVYDSNNGREYFADPGDESSTTKYEYSFVGTLSDSGYAVGFYNTYTGATSSTETTTTVFVWSELGKLQPLYSFANTRATNNYPLQSYVSAFQFGADGELYGPNNYTVATSIVAYGLNVIWNNSLGAGDGQTWDTTSQNWTNGVIPLVYINSAMVTFNDNNNGHYAVTLNSVVTPNSVTFNNSAGNYTLSGTGGLSGAGGLTKLGTGSVTLSTGNTYTGPTNISGGSLLLAVAGALPSGTNLNIGSGASVVAENLGTRYALTVGSLAVTGRLNLNNNGIVVQNSSIGTVTSFLKSGYANGTWNGSAGIISSTAAANTGHLTSVGVIINDTGSNTGASTGTPLYGTLDATPAADGNILVKYTYYGDANLSGAVDGSDYSLVDNGFLRQLTGWYNGDFNYDGVVNGSDYTLMDNAFNMQAAAFNSQIAGPTTEVAPIAGGSPAVPEPSSLPLLAAAITTLSGRWRTGRRFDRH